MTVYGWNPSNSAFIPTPDPSSIGPAASMPSTDQQSAVQTTNAAMNCQAPTWWYSLLALAAIAGFAAKGRA